MNFTPDLFKVLKSHIDLEDVDMKSQTWHHIIDVHFYVFCQFVLYIAY